MGRIPVTSFAMLLLALPAGARAMPGALTVPATATAGAYVVLRWDRLPDSVREVEVELSLDGGRWVRVSPERDATDGRFVWRVPEVASARARLRLRAGGDGFECELLASGEFRIDARVAPNPSAGGLEWWKVGEHAHARGWGTGGAAASLAPESVVCVAETAPQSEISAPGPSVAAVRLDVRDAVASPAVQGTLALVSQRYPLRN